MARFLVSMTVFPDLRRLATARTRIAIVIDDHELSSIPLTAAQIVPL